ncbi:MAG TPA: choice-of-anchor D domain-containing protein, partial [Vicinamibacterales bacterium]|nr:choice-of-anchor D domain-containing protein [Vicinamibacterales bacterium]
MRSALPVEISGEPGIGRTALLRRVAHLSDLATTPHGVVYLNAVGQLTGDLLQSLFDAFYESPSSFKPTPSQLQRLLHDRRAVLLLDDVDLTRDGIEQLLDAVPESSVVIADRQRTLWAEAQSIELGGLPEAESVLLLARELGRAVSEGERPAAKALATSLGGHPIRLLQAGATARRAQVSLNQIVSHVESRGPSALTAQLVMGLGDEDRRVLAALVAVGMALSANAVAAIAQLADPGPSLQRLADRGLVQARRDRYGLVPGVAIPQDITQAAESSSDRVQGFYSEWAAAHARTPDAIASDADTLLRVQADAAAKGESSRVLRIGTALGVVLAVSGRWEAWAAVLDRNLAAARAIGDRAAEGLALHDAGTRALCVGDKAVASRLLKQAIEIRSANGDRLGAAISRHNASLVSPVPVDPADSLPRPQEIQIDYDTLRSDGIPHAAVPAGSGSSWAATALLVVLGLAGIGGLSWWYTQNSVRTPIPVDEPGATVPVPPVVAGPTAPGPSVQPAAPTETRPAAVEPSAPTATHSPDVEPPPAPAVTPTPPPATVPGAGAPVSRAVASLPDAIDFGPSTVKASGGRRPIVVRSRGSEALSVGRVALVGDHQGDFRIVSNGCTGTELRDADAECTIEVEFAPVAVGVRSARLQLADNSNQSPRFVALSGEARPVPVPRPRLSPDRLEFSQQVVGQPGTARRVTVTNEGSATLSIQRVLLEGRHPRDFTITGTDCTGANLPPQGTCTVDVGFGPTAAGRRAGSLTVVHNAGDAGRNVDLNGTAEARPMADVSPPRLEFDEQPLEKSSRQRSVRIANAGGGVLQVGRITLEGVNRRDFSLENRCTQSGRGLRRGESCEVLVQFVPDAAGARSAVMVVTQTDGIRHEVALSGVGVGRGVLAVLPESLEFGVQELKTSREQQVTVTNAGSAVLAVASIAVDKSGAREYAVVDPQKCANQKLDPGGKCTFGVRFTPAGVDERPASISVADATGSRISVALSGAGASPRPSPVSQLSFKPDRLDFGELVVPSRQFDKSAGIASRAVTLTNVGNVDVVVADVLVEPAESSREFQIQDKCRGARLAPQQDCTVRVTFRASAPGPRQASLVFLNNAAKNPHRVALFGFGREATIPNEESKRCSDFVADIGLDVVRHTKPYVADVRITGLARNLGPSVLSEPGGMIWLYEGNRLVREDKLSAVDVGNVVSVVYERQWDSASPSEGEFPPTYRVVVKGPTDCSGNNNEVRRSGADLNTKIRETMPPSTSGVKPDPLRPIPGTRLPLPVIGQFIAVDKPGQPRQLCYAVKGATSARIEPGVGPVKPLPNQTCVRVSPVRTTEYVLMADNADGAGVKRSVTFVVTSPQRLQQPPPPAVAK